MRQKKAKKPARSIRYLLSADQKLRRLSLKKIRSREKKAKPSTRSDKVKEGTVRTKKPAPASWSLKPAAIVAGLVFVIAAAGLMASRQSDGVETVNEAPTASADARLESVRAAAQPDATATLAPIETSTGPVSKATTSPAAAPKAKTPAGPSASPSVPLSKAVSREAARPTGEESTRSIDLQDLATVTGCVALDKEGFWLKDTSGSAAPKSRSWKSGFLARRPAPVALRDPAGTLGLTGYVGHRVAATGRLVDREMRARSMRRLADSCE